MIVEMMAIFLCLQYEKCPPEPLQAVSGGHFYLSSCCNAH